MKNLKLLLCFVALIHYSALLAQNIFPSSGAAGIGTTTPDASSLLEIKSTSKGLLIPRMTQAQRNAITSPATGLFIYQTNATPGFYYYSGTAWTAVTQKSKGWSLTGNSGTNPSTNFIGTTDAQPLVFRVNNNRAGYVDNNLGAVSLGYLSLNANTATGNTALGYEAANSNTTGQSNTAIGNLALLANTTGTQNTATGSFALESNTASDNTANGYFALASNTTATNNTADGALSLHATTTGGNNAALGQKAGYDNTGGISNVFVGASSGGGNTSGSSNTFLGYNAGTSSTNGSNNVCLGANSAILNGGANSVVIGNGVSTSQNYTIVLGNNAGLFQHQIGIGTNAPPSGYDVYVTTQFATGLYATTSATSGNGVIGEADNGGVPYGIWGVCSNTSLGEAGYFQGNLTYTGTLSGPSDVRLKENINPLTNALSIVNQLAPRSYNFKAEYSYMNLAKGKQFGFIAQDVEKVLPELVVTNYDKSKDPQNPFTYKAVNYIGFIPVLTAAMQELSQKNDALQKQNNDLQDRVAKLETIVNQLTSGSSVSSTVANQNSLATSSPILMQNAPNPFNLSSTIRFTLPSTATNATIVITDMAGKPIKQFTDLPAGNGMVTVEGNTLSPGTYIYSLLVNGKKIDTKQMVLVK
jgi:hypothetical protein